jgi:hypothetical protein
VNFTPACVKSAAPRIYLVDTFVEGQGRLTAYPETVRRAFKSAFEENISLFERRSAQTPPGKPGAPLFEITRLNNLAAVPAILGGGDIVLGMTLFPPYKLNKDFGSGEWSDLVGPEPDPSRKESRLSQAMQAMDRRFWDEIVRQWRARCAGAPPRRQHVPLMAEPGLSLAYRDNPTVTLKKGGQRKIYYAVRLGLIDAAFPAAAAVWAWNAGKQRSAQWAVLKKHEFSPQGVAAAAQTKNRTANDSFLQQVGRGMAYDLLHELCHAALRSADHPVDDNKIIESVTGAKPRPGLKLQAATVTKVLAEYRDTWCSYQTKGCVNLAALK